MSLTSNSIQAALIVLNIFFFFFFFFKRMRTQSWVDMKWLEVELGKGSVWAWYSQRVKIVNAETTAHIYRAMRVVWGHSE